MVFDAADFVHECAQRFDNTPFDEEMCEMLNFWRKLRRTVFAVPDDVKIDFAIVITRHVVSLDADKSSSRTSEKAHEWASVCGAQLVYAGINAGATILSQEKDRKRPLPGHELVGPSILVRLKAIL